MSRLFAYMGNDQDRVKCALHPAHKLLVADGAAQSSFDAWGLGFYQGGEVLLQRRPKPPTEPVDFYALVKDLRTDAIIGHVRQGTVGQPKNENTHPFRFRSWLFAHHGTVPSFDAVRDELLSAVPDFLRRNIRGQTDSEHLFHVMLAFLHDAGRLDDPNVSTAHVAAAVRGALALVEKAAGKSAADAMECALALTNGRVLAVTRHGGPVYLQERTSMHDCAVCREPPPRDKRMDHDHLRSVLVVADVAPPTPDLKFVEVPDRTLLVISHDLKVEQLPLAA
ncbi:MAG: glutamine amidotransferase, class-II [Myxococcales bacterium]|nr:glutamine amidotransferase, class-II [Myxococcales bacterium]